MPLLLAALLLLAGPSSTTSQKIPITTTSEEARREYLAGRTLVENLRNTDAIEHFRKATALDPSFALAHLGLSNVAPTATEFQTERALAVKYLDKASEGEQLLIRAAEAGAAARPLEARKDLERLTQLYPADARAQFQLGLNYMASQDWPHAIESLSRAITIEPEYAAPYNQRGYAHRFSGDFKRAEEDFKNYIKRLPTDPNPYDSYAELLLATGRYNESIGEYKRALDVRATFLPSRIGVISNLTYLGRHRDAIGAVDDYLKASRNIAERNGGYYQAAAVYVDQDQYGKAMAEIDKSLAANKAAKDHAAASFDAGTLSRINLEKGDLAEADRWEHQSEEMIAAANQPPDVRQATELGFRYNRALILINHGKLDAARQEIAKHRAEVTARQFAFGIRQANELDGILALAEKRWDDAAKSLQLANLQNPYNLYRLGLAYEGKNDLKQAKSYYDQTVQLNQLLNLNYAYVRNKAKAKAMKLGQAGARQSE